MKTPAFTKIAAGLIGLASLCNLPVLGLTTITEYNVWKLVSYNQTDLSTTTIHGGNAYYFMTGVSGTNVNVLPTPSVVVPSGTATGTPPLSLNAQNQWGKFAGYGTSAALDAVYGNSGTYVLNVDGTHTLSGSLDSGGGTTYLAPAHVTNGTWSAGALQVDPSSAYTVHFDAFPGGVTNGAIDFLLRDQTATTVSYLISPNTVLQDWVIPAFTLSPGQTYSGTIGFFNLSTPLEIDLLNSGSMGSIGMATSLNFTIAAIPEPATYAALGGLAALVLVFFRHRRCNIQ